MTNQEILELMDRFERSSIRMMRLSTNAVTLEMSKDAPLAPAMPAAPGAPAAPAAPPASAAPAAAQESAKTAAFALRILRACRESGMETVAVYSTADEKALYVQLATQGVCIGPAAAGESYLNQNALLALAKATGYDGVHPGYGFLSENADFADACRKAGLTFIGPGGDVIRRAGDKAAARKMMRAAGVRVTCVRCDVSDAQQVKGMMRTVVKEYGRIDVLVNNAGVTRDSFLLMMRESDYDAVLDTNLKGTFLRIKNVVHTMMKQSYGRIVNVSSVTGLHGKPGQANYAASKAGVIGLTKATAKELAMKNITVNAVAPGFIETDMTAAMNPAALAVIPAGRLGQAQEVARAVAFLASDEAAYITGQVLAIDGGMSM